MGSTRIPGTRHTLLRLPHLIWRVPGTLANRRSRSGAYVTYSWLSRLATDQPNLLTTFVTLRSKGDLPYVCHLYVT